MNRQAFSGLRGGFSWGAPEVRGETAAVLLVPLLQFLRAFFTCCGCACAYGSREFRWSKSTNNAAPTLKRGEQTPP